MVITMICAGCATCTATAASINGSSANSSERMSGAQVSARAAPGDKPRLQRSGQHIVGKPYVVEGKLYYPKEEPSYDRRGVASWYGSAFHGRRTANGETYDSQRLSAAHATLPLPSYVRVTNLENGSSVIVRVNDRGPYHDGRLIDLSSKAADMLDLKPRGTASVRVQYVGRPGLGGNDMAFLMASHVKKGRNARAFSSNAGAVAGTRVASMQRTRISPTQVFLAKYTRFAGYPSSTSYHPLTASAANTIFAQPVGLRPAGGVAALRRSPTSQPIRMTCKQLWDVTFLTTALSISRKCLQTPASAHTTGWPP